MIMNMQNKLYIILYFSPPDDWFAVSPWAEIAKPRTQGFLWIFAKLLKKAKLPENFELPDKRGFKLTDKSRMFPAPCPTPIHKLSITSMVWNISIDQLGYLPVCAPSQLLHTCSLAEYEKLEKVLDFISTTENIGVNTILVLNPEHSSCWEEN